MTSVYDSAEYIITEMNRREVEITHLKLQKLLYFSYIYHYKKNNVELFDENFNAWAYGPVIEEIYKIYKKYRDLPIKLQRKNLNLSKMEKESLNFVIETLGFKDPFDLVKISHSKDAPWYRVFIENESQGGIISMIELIRIVITL